MQNVTIAFKDRECTVFSDGKPVDLKGCTDITVKLTAAGIPTVTLTYHVKNLKFKTDYAGVLRYKSRHKITAIKSGHTERAQDKLSKAIASMHKISNTYRPNKKDVIRRVIDWVKNITKGIDRS